MAAVIHKADILNQNVRVVDLRLIHDCISDPEAVCTLHDNP